MSRISQADANHHAAIREKLRDMEIDERDVIWIDIAPVWHRYGALENGSVAPPGMAVREDWVYGGEDDVTVRLYSGAEYTFRLIGARS